MKRITLIILAATAIIAGGVSCSKVNDLDKRLTQLEQTVSDLKVQVLAGAVITSVEKNEGGCTFTLSNGQSYIVTNGKNGTDGEAIIADVKVEEDFVVLTLKNGEILRISYQNPLSMVTLSIVPDYDDGTVKEPKTTETMGTKSHNFYLDVAVTPAKYAEILADTEKYIHKAVFSPVQTKGDFGNAFTVSPKGVTYMEGAPVPFLQASFEFDDETAAVLTDKNSAYTVSYSIEDKDGVHGAATAFASCQKENNDTPATEGTRVLTLSFDSGTKVTLNGLQPEFQDKEYVRISNGSAYEDKQISVDDDGVATITTSLSGSLTAVIPPDAANMNGNQIDGVIIKASQTGAVSDALICMAKGTADATSLHFKCQTAVFEITPPEGATSITIKSLKQIGTDGQRSGIALAINTAGANDAEKCVINVPVGSDGKAYVSLFPGVNLSDLSFDAGGAIGMKGIPSKSITADVTEANTKYTINGSNWHPYVEITMTVNKVQKTYKWATMNIGATASNPNGDYFMWGYTVGHTATTIGDDAFSGQDFGASETRGNNSKGFVWDNYIRFTSSTYSESNKKVFTKYVPSNKASEYGYSGTFYDGKTTLDLADDAANANWGGSWRMPTEKELSALVKLQVGSFASGWYFGTSDNAQIFLPAAGYGDGTGLRRVGGRGHYWSSSLAEWPNNADYLVFYEGVCSSTGHYYHRRYGQSVRALSE